MHYKLWHRLDLHYPDPVEMSAETICVTFKKTGEPLLFKSNGTGWYGEHGALVSLTLGTAKAYWCKYDDFLASFDDELPEEAMPAETRQLIRGLSAMLAASGLDGKKANVTADCTAAVCSIAVVLKQLGVKFCVNAVITGTDVFTCLHVADMFVANWRGPDPDVIVKMLHTVKS